MRMWKELQALKEKLKNKNEIHPSHGCGRIDNTATFRRLFAKSNLLFCWKAESESDKR